MSFGEFLFGSKPKKNKYGVGDMMQEQWLLTNDVKTPYGSVTYSKDPKTKKMVQSVNLSPEQQALLRQSEGVSGGANLLAQRLLAGMEGGAAQVGDSIYGQAKSRLDPQFADEERAMINRLYGQGIPENSAAWNQAMDTFRRGKTDAYQTAINNSVMGRDQSLATQSNVATQQAQLGRPAEMQPPAINPNPTGGVTANIAAQNANRTKSGGIMGPLLNLGGQALGGWAYGGFA